MFKMTVTVPRADVRADIVRDKILNALHKSARQVKRVFESTTETWQEHHVKFEAKVHFTRGGDMAIEAGPVSGTTDARGKNSVDIWNWLNEGTAVRRALLAPNFRVKTAPGKIKAGSGQSPAWVKARMYYNFAGIEARSWTEAISIDQTPEFQAGVVNALREGMKQFVAQSNAGAAKK